jgi:recombination protein RecA
MAKAVKTEGTKDPFMEAVTALEKRYGAGTVIFGKDVASDYEIVPTGSLNLDVATNLGGNPIGKLIEIFGPESSGKSTTCLHMIANFQKIPGKVVLMDYEHSFDKKYAAALGVDVDNLVIMQPDNKEDGYNQAEVLIKTGMVRLIIIDSHTAALPKKVIEGEVGDAVVGLEARINSTALGKLHPLLGANRCTMIGVSQLRTKIGDYGDPDKPSGGNAWKFYSDIRYKVSRSVDKVNSCNKTVIEVIKNKCAPPFGKAEFRINWGTGIDRPGEVIDLGVEFDLIKLGGAGWYTIGETKLQGMDKVKQFLSDNPEYAAELEKTVLEKVKEIK